jgi:hypothetical protein
MVSKASKAMIKHQLSLKEITRKKTNSKLAKINQVKLLFV